MGDQRRGIKYDLLMTRFKIAAPNVRFIFLSAVVPDTTLEELAHWLNTDTDSTLRTEWRPSIQRIAELRWSGLTGTLHYVPESDAPLLSQAFTPGIIRQQEIKFPNPATGRILTRRFPDTTNKAQIAAELALKFVDTGSVLVFCSLPNYTTAVGQAIVDRFAVVIRCRPKGCTWANGYQQHYLCEACSRMVGRRPQGYTTPAPRRCYSLRCPAAGS